MVRGKTKTLQAILTTAVAVLSATSAVAQVSSSGVTGSFSFASTLSYDTNPGLAAVSPGSVLEFSEDLDYSMRAETGQQFFALGAGTGFSISSVPGGGTSTSFDKPRINLRFFRETFDADLSASANYFSGDVRSAFELIPGDASSLIVDTGTITIYGAAVESGWRQDAPLSFSANASFNMRDYDGTTDPSLLDTTTTVVGVGAGLRISPTTQGTAAIGFKQISTSAGGPDTVDNGVIADFGVVHTVRNGTFFGNIEFDNSGAENNTAVTVGRTFALPGSTFSASATAESSPSSGLRLLGDAGYSKEISDGEFTVDVSQEISTNSLGEDIKLSSVVVAYEKAVNASDSVSLSIDVARTQDGGAGAAATQNRAALSASYARSLTPGWDLAIGYTRQQNSGSAIASANSDKLFLTLTRDIEFGF